MIFLVPNCEAKANGLIKAATNDDRFVSTHDRPLPSIIFQLVTLKQRPIPIE